MENTTGNGEEARQTEIRQEDDQCGHTDRPRGLGKPNQVAASLGMTRTELITQISRVKNPEDLQAFQEAKYLGECLAN
jgi:hypothetical protein